MGSDRPSDSLRCISISSRTELPIASHGCRASCFRSSPLQCSTYPGGRATGSTNSLVDVMIIYLHGLLVRSPKYQEGLETKCKLERVRAKEMKIRWSRESSFAIANHGLNV